MKVYQVERRRRNERGVFAIYPADCWDPENPGRLLPEKELGRIRARARGEAVTLAGRAGIGAGVEIWAIEVVPDSRVKLIEE